MSFIKKILNVLHSRGCSYLFFILSVCAFVFLDSAKWAYGWMDDPNSVVNGIENTLNRYVTNW